MGHAVYSPSSAKRWILCPGSARLAAAAPLRPVGEAALLGTRVHLLAERRIKRELGFDVTTPKPTAEEDRLAQVFVDFFRSLKREDPDTSFFVEERVYIHPPHCWGTADLVAWQRTLDTLVVADLKTGRWEVSPDDPQLQLYGAGALDIFKLHRPRRVRLVVVQPQVDPLPREVSLEPWELDLAKATAAAAISRGERDPPDLSPGEHCRFCPAKPTCPALRKRWEDQLPALDDDED